jgi:hypothetical protein
MRRRLLVVLASVAACLGTALVAVPALPAQASTPGWGWPPCSGASTHCVFSQTRNGGPILNTDADQPVIDLIDPGTVRYGVVHDDFGDGSSWSGDVNPSDTYQLVVRTGSIRPREVLGNIRNVAFSIGSDATGWTFTLTFQPTPVHHVGYNGDTRTCTIGACGDDTWRASLDYDGFVTGYVTDLASSGLGATEISQRVGMISAYNAQDANTFYDPDSNSLVVQLANPHLTGTGAVATGSYETFLPTAFLEGTMNVPDASTLSSGTVTVVRTAGGVVSSAPFTLTHVPGGVQITITGITYSSPTYKIHPGPGKPRYVHARKISTHKARVRFTKPASNGGYRINGYQARCHRLGKAWHSAKGTSSPLTVGNLPRGRVYCQVRAHNKLGYGGWSALVHT